MRMPDDRTSTWAYACLLTGGLLIVAVGLMAALSMAAFGGMMGFGMMGGYAPWVSPSWFAGMAWWMGAIGLATGGLVLFAAYLLRRDEESASMAGTLAIVGGALSLLAMGGWILGAFLSVLGGVLALTSRAPGAKKRGEAPR